MKVLLLFPTTDGQTGPALQYAFEQLGHEVMIVDAKREPGNSYNTACYFMPKLVFCSRTKELADEILKIKLRFKDITICMWNVDTRADINQWSSLFRLVDLCDYYFVVNDYHVAEWNERFKAKTVWLPQGVQNEQYYKPDNITNEDRKYYSCDVSFAGTCRKKVSYNWRKDCLDAVRKMGVNLKTWGCENNPRLYNVNHNKMASLSKINLGMSRLYDNKVRKCVSVRDYKIMGAGGFLLELQRTGLDELFPLGVSGIIGTYVSPNDLVERIRYWLSHEKERQAMAERGHEWVLANATYTHRMKKALEIMKL